MKKLILITTLFFGIVITVTLLLTALGSVYGQAVKQKDDPNKLFYAANLYYQKQDFSKAIESYAKILDMELENGNLYYNIGNSFLKLGKIGHAILSYEKASRFIPHDSDLKANMEYAKALVRGSSNEKPHRNPVLRTLLVIYDDFNLNAVALISLSTYLLLLSLLALAIINPIIGRKLLFIVALLMIIVIINSTALAVRYYQERVLTHGIVILKGIDAKYEPIGKSTTYYHINEGDEVLILKTKEGWRQIRRGDGKVGWVKKEAVGEI